MKKPVFMSWNKEFSFFALQMSVITVFYSFSTVVMRRKQNKSLPDVCSHGSMCPHVWVLCMHVCMAANTSSQALHLHFDVCACMHSRVSMHACVVMCGYMRWFLCVHALLCVCACMCMCLWMCTYVCTKEHIHAHTHTHKYKDNIN